MLRRKEVGVAGLREVGRGSRKAGTTPTEAADPEAKGEPARGGSLCDWLGGKSGFLCLVLSRK